MQESRGIAVLVAAVVALTAGDLGAESSFFCEGTGTGKYTLKIPVPGLSLEGPYLSDVNNSGPYLGDLNNDGAIDIAVSPWGTSLAHASDPERFIKAFYNQNGTFRAEPDLTINQNAVGTCLIGDFDADEMADLASVFSGTFRVYLGKLSLSGHSDTQDTRLLPGGWMDIPYGLSEYGRLELKEQDPFLDHCDFIGGARWRRLTVREEGLEIRLGLFHPAESEQWAASRMADLDGDGTTDVVVVSRQSKGYEGPEKGEAYGENRTKIRLYYGPFPSMEVRPGELAKFTELTLPGDAPEIALELNAIADLNNDRKPDLVLTSGERTLIFHQNPDGGFSADAKPSKVIADSDRRTSVADVNRDGLNDLIICRSASQEIDILLNHDGQIRAGSAKDADQKLPTPRPQSIALADLNADGWTDLVVRGKGGIQVYFNTQGKAEPSTTGEATGPLTPAVGPAETQDDGRRMHEKQALTPRDPIRKPTDDPYLMPYYTGKVYPTPQKASYRGEYLPLDDVGVLVDREIENPDPPLEVLIERIKRYGGNATLEKSFGGKHTTWVSLGDTPLTSKVEGVPQTPDREEGYVLSMGKADGKPVVVLKGRDRLGLLWAISSFNQLVHLREARPVVRAAEIQDYPVGLQRGYLFGRFTETFTPRKSVLYNVHFKLNRPVYRHAAFSYLTIDHPIMSWRDPENQTVFERECIRQLGEMLTPLGIEWYGGMHPHHCPYEYKLSGAPEDLAIMMKYAEMIVQAGGHFYLMFDDHRFWMNPYDEKAFGTARRADVHVVNAIVGRLSAKYPDTKLLYCPPFYWGPQGGVAKWYGETREEYLSYVGEHLSDKVEVHWTGARVRSPGAKKEHVEWITERIRRKPVFWQNWALNRHPTDPIEEWPKWLYEGFLGDMNGYYLNAPDNVLLATIADYCWNPRAYDPEQSVREAIGKLLGPGSFDRLREADALLSQADKYWGFVYLCANGKYTSCPDAAKEVEALEDKVAKASAIYAEVLDQRPGASQWAPETRVSWYANFVRRTRKDPKLMFYTQTEAQKRRARKEVGYSPERDAFLAACDFRGRGAQEIARMCGLEEDLGEAGEDEMPGLEGEEKRPAAVLSGNEPTATVQFDLPPSSGEARWKLILSGRTTLTGDDTDETKPKVRISMNKKALFQGESPLDSMEWSKVTYEIPSKLLKPKQNNLTLQLVNPNPAQISPVLSINYGVVRKAKER